VPSDVDFVIEGFVDPEEDFLLEGPFGDHTGFYSLADFYPCFHVTCITHRKYAIYPTTVVGIPPMEDGWIGKATERLFLFPMKLVSVPELKDINMPVAGAFHNIALTRIEKSFPGQGLKIMTSLWGAGQMMFNKIMIVLSSDVDLNDYKAVAIEVSRRTDPLQDIQFIKGPVDILDHSSRRFSFGSKIGIDATIKWPEEIEDTSSKPTNSFINSKAILKRFPEVIAINDRFLSEGISLIVITIKKNRICHLRDLSAEFMKKGLIKDIKFLLFLDPNIDIFSPMDIAWIAGNNIDPMRDCFNPVNDGGAYYPMLVIDGTRKTKDLDSFTRDWPNVIVMDDNITRKIDAEWDKFGLGPLIPSPSEKYKMLIINNGAVVG
jgi:4-hydroxy-3-polyprenylbenzoate decarboxylase